MIATVDMAWLGSVLWVGIRAGCGLGSVLRVGIHAGCAHPVPPAASEANAHQPAEQRKQACHHVRPTANPMASMRAEAPNMEKVAAGKASASCGGRGPNPESVEEGAIRSPV